MIDNAVVLLLLLLLFCSPTASFSAAMFLGLPAMPVGCQPPFQFQAATSGNSCVFVD